MLHSVDHMGGPGVYPLRATWPRKLWVVLVLLAAWGCADPTVEGVWREEFPVQESSSPGDVGGPSGTGATDGRVVVHEVALAQYGPDVAGAVWFYDQSALSNTLENPFGWPTFCRFLQKGRFHQSTGKLGFEFNDEQGAPVYMWLSLEGDGQRLSGTVYSLEPDSGAPDNKEGEVKFTRKVVFHKVSHDPHADYQSGQCSGINSIYITGKVESGQGGNGQSQQNQAVALVAYGVYLEQPFSVVVSSAPIHNGRFVFNLSQKPMARSLAVDTGENSFSLFTFVLFDDLNGDGVWDGGVWPGGSGSDGVVRSDGERVLGVADSHVLVWLTGRMGSHLTPYHYLMDDVPQGYSLLEVESDQEGTIQAVQVIPTENSVVAHEVVISEGHPGPVFDFFNYGVEF